MLYASSCSYYIHVPSQGNVWSARPDQLMDEEEAGRLVAFFGGDAAAERFNGRKPVLVCGLDAGTLEVAALGLDTACWKDASLEPKKLPKPPMVLLISGMAEARGGESSMTVAGIGYAALSSEPVSNC